MDAEAVERLAKGEGSRIPSEPRAQGATVAVQQPQHWDGVGGTRMSPLQQCSELGSRAVPGPSGL